MNEVLTEARGRVLLITLNRPEAMNAIDAALAAGLVAAVEQLDRESEFTAGVLTGAGRGFCSGMDLKAFATSGPPRGIAEFLHHGARKPLIAAVEGFVHSRCMISKVGVIPRVGRGPIKKLAVS